MKNFDLEPFDEETKILMQYVNNNFLINTVEKVEFMTPITLSEIFIYDIKKMYIAKKINISDNVNISSLSYVQFYDHNNIIQFECNNCSVYWNNLLNISVKGISNLFILKNILFSRISNINIFHYNRFQMIGYRITLQ